MIITRTPFRTSFAGGGSDVRWYYQARGSGAVLSAAITQYMYIVIHPYFHDKRIRLKYSETEDITSVDQISHSIIRCCLQRFNLAGGLEITSFADVPAGTGLGSSSAFTVGLLHALHAWRGEMVSKHQLAEEACEIEIDVLGKPIGKQDQYAAAFGGVQVYQFNRDESVSVTPVLISRETHRGLKQRLRLYYVSGTRSADEILRDQNSERNREDKGHQIDALVKQVAELKVILEAGKLSQLGPLLHSGWKIKQGISSKISNTDVVDTYQKARDSGAIGGKLLGAGGTGFFLLDSPDHERLGDELGLRTLPFDIDNEGSKVIYFEPQ